VKKKKPGKMTGSGYARLRRSLGSQTEVARMLGVHRMTISKREREARDCPVTREAEFALRYLHEQRRGRPTW
jgi:hypothetical protein